MAKLVVDENIIEVLPSVKEIVSVSKSGESAWARASRIDVLHEDNSKESYFMKVSQGHDGLESLKGEYESTSAIYSITPDFCPRPIAWGTFKTDNDSHFYICKFYEFTDGLPNPKMFCANLARLHSSHSSPTGRFGFHVVTYNGDLPQDNTWSDSWEAFFESGFRHVLNVREARAGPSAELDELLQPFFGNVIPRLLRPLETGGNTIQPSLVHGDLWCGNAAITDEDTEEGIVFDPSSFWGHNEYELGNWRPERNKFTRKYFNAYHSHIPKSAPEDDYDDRNALYAMRFNLNAATLFPSQKVYLDMVIDEMKRLVEKFPDGYTGHSPRADILARQNANAMAVRKNAEVQQYAVDVDGASAFPSEGQSVSAEIEL
ncbi:Fructosamine kinase-domain-containing protein [Xylaria bambusicola]|uniref:Fructosamine kinase-domain-containing protein n=1 Tax=Xylaria bambusicola TaxID=326684 RepID=UPI002007888D|nr:Fructosamine kinase-domain-containing protein [Xylaria bambusicola]KAI0527862.1 Fructosamine kinase-domain-containing protein [Xylaria bambusicola]